MSGPLPPQDEQARRASECKRSIRQRSQNRAIGCTCPKGRALRPRCTAGRARRPARGCVYRADGAEEKADLWPSRNKCARPKESGRCCNRTWRSRIAMAIRIAPVGPNITCDTAVATRPSAAYSMPRETIVAPLRVARDGQNAQIGDVGESVEQNDEPRAERERKRQVAAGISHFGGVNVTQSQASIEKSEPTIATPTNVSVPIIHCGLSGGYGCISDRPPLRQKSVKFACAQQSRRKEKPSRTSRPAKRSSRP